MRPSSSVAIAIVVVGLLGAPPDAGAQNAPAQPDPTAQALQAEIEQLRLDFIARLTALEARLAAMQGQPPAAAEAPALAQPAGEAAAVAESPATPAQATAEVPAGAAGAGGPSGALPVYGAASSASKVFNPDMAVIGNFLGTSGHNAVDPGPALQMRESEASFQAVVDPYARADFFLAFGEQGVDLEEGFVTFPTIPGGLLVKAGKVRAAFGKVNTLHTHAIPWSDRPLVTNNLLGGEEGIADAGVSVARLIPNPWIFLEATGQVFRGDAGDVFHSSEPSDLSYVGHLRAYQDLGEATNIDFGGSYSRGHSAGVASDFPVRTLAEDQTFLTDLFGIDATLRWRPLRRSIYHSFIGRSELVWSHRDQPSGLQRSSGFYVSGDYQLARRWFVGARLDRSDRAQDATLTDTGQSLLLTYWPSEFSQVRSQYRRTAYADGPVANEFLFQLQFSIGAHGAHPF